jgi:hypothetical protein
MMYFEKIVNIQTGEETIREFTAQEIAEREASDIELAEAQRLQEERALQRAEIIAKLGLTEEEVAILFFT